MKRFFKFSMLAFLSITLFLTEHAFAQDKAFYDEISLGLAQNTPLKAVIELKCGLNKDAFEFQALDLDEFRIIPRKDVIHEVKNKIKLSKGHLVKNIKISYKGKRIRNIYKKVKWIDVKCSSRIIAKIIEKDNLISLFLEKAYNTNVTVIEGKVYVLELDMFGRIIKRKIELAPSDYESVLITPGIPSSGEEEEPEEPPLPSKSVSTWNIANTAGFGSSNNLDTAAMISFKGSSADTYLYAGTFNASGKAELHRSPTPVSASSWSDVTPSALANTQTAIFCFALDSLINATKIYMGTGVASGAISPGEVWRSADGSSWTKISSVGSQWQVDSSDSAADAPSVTSLEVVGNYIYAGISFNRHNAEIWRINTSDDSFEQLLTKTDISDSSLTNGSNYGKVSFIRYHNPYIYVGCSPTSGNAGTVIIRSTFTVSGQGSIDISDSSNRLSNWTLVKRLND